MQLSPLDIFFLAVVAVAALRSAYRGFVAEVMSVAALVVGIGAAVLLSGRAAALLAQKLGPSIWNKVIAFLVIFLLSYLVVKIIERALEGAVENLSLGGLDHALGFFLGIAEGLLVVAVMVLILQIQPFVKVDSALRASKIATLLMQLFPLLPVLHGRVGSV